MKTAIIGYGQMGKQIESILLDRGHTVTVRVDPSGSGDAKELTEDLLADSDTAIEFALPQGLRENTEIYCSSGTAAVVGTTGWDKRREEIRNLVEEAGGTFMWGSNFSVGAHLFFKLAEQAAALLNKAPGYDIMLHEYHHKKKKDSPSGTALVAAEKILAANNQKSAIVTETLQREIEEHELHVSSTRGGAIPGIHSLLLDSEADSIEIRHTARSRKGFALGAVLAAEWLIGKKGFFRVEDFIDDTFRS